MLVVAAGREILLLRLRANGIGGWTLRRIFASMFREKFLLHSLGKRIDCKAWLRLARLLRERDAIAHRQNSFAADESETLRFTRAADEVHLQREVECGM